MPVVDRLSTGCRSCIESERGGPSEKSGEDVDTACSCPRRRETFGQPDEPPNRQRLNEPADDLVTGRRRASSDERPVLSPDGSEPVARMRGTLGMVILARVRRHSFTINEQRILTSSTGIKTNY